MIRWLFACAMLMLTSAAVFAAPDTGDLFDLCPPDEGMRLVIESLDEDAIRGDLTEEQIRNAAESRLRAAGTYDPEADPFLYINVNTGAPQMGHFRFFAICLIRKSRNIASTSYAETSPRKNPLWHRKAAHEVKPWEIEPPSTPPDVPALAGAPPKSRPVSLWLTNLT